MFDVKTDPPSPECYAQFKTDEARLEFARIAHRPHTLRGWARVLTALAAVIASVLAYLFAPPAWTKWKTTTAHAGTAAPQIQRAGPDARRESLKEPENSHMFTNEDGSGGNGTGGGK